MKVGLLVSLGLFLVACCLPALEWRSNKGVIDVMFGLRALVVGWSGLFAAVFGWYANPFLVIGLIFGLFRKPVPMVIAGAIGLAITTTVFGVIGRELPGDESNVTKTTIVRLLPGCYVWMASFVVLILSAFLPKTR